MNSAEAGVGLGYLEGHGYYLMMDADGSTVRHDMQYRDDHRGDAPYKIQEAVWFCQEMNEDLLKDALSYTSSDAAYLSDLLQSERILDVLAVRMTQAGDPSRCAASGEEWMTSISSSLSGAVGRKLFRSQEVGKQHLYATKV